MNLITLVDRLNIQVLCGEISAENNVTWSYVSDLLSDVMGKAGEGNIWITLQSHKNIVAVALLKELSAILLVNGVKPDEETLFHARKEGVVMLSTTLPAFEITGKIYNLLIQDE